MKPAHAPQNPADGRVPDAAGHFGPYGGRYVAETLMPALLELEESYRRITPDPLFRQELSRLLRDFVGRPTPLFPAERLTRHVGGAAGTGRFRRHALSRDQDPPGRNRLGR